MPEASKARNHALLVGINEYAPGNHRTSPVRLHNLKGCIDDVEDIKSYLLTTFNGDIEITSFTSPSKDEYPTFDNISNKFSAISEKAQAGDFFIFHFSGHGKLLPRTSGSPNKDTDPSLITFDYRQGGRPIRGWELNKWLQVLHDKKVQIVVFLDSCYSGGSWRRDGDLCRTPAVDGWDDASYSLPSDCDTTDNICPTAADDVRYATLGPSCSINPQGFTLMVACEHDQQAAEKTVDGKSNGAFTRALLKTCSTSVAYRAIRDQVATILPTSQTPRVYGQDRLLFLGTSEIVAPVQIPASVDGKLVRVPVGAYHGVGVGAEFLYFPLAHLQSRSAAPPARTNVVIERVEHVHSEAQLPDSLQGNVRRWIGLLPSRWSLSSDGQGPFKVYSDHSLGECFRESLLQVLKQYITSPLQVLAEGTRQGGFLWMTRSGQDGLEIHGPGWLIGHDGPLRGVDLGARDVEASAAAILHLCRFGQILQCKSTSRSELPFSIRVEAQKDPNATIRQKEVRYVFRNQGRDVLYVVLLNLSLDYSICQVWPIHEPPVLVPGQHEEDISFSLAVPAQLANISGPHREVIRTIVTRRQEWNLMWKCVELPSISNTKLPLLQNITPLIRPGEVQPRASPETNMWIIDREIYID